MECADALKRPQGFTSETRLSRNIFLPGATASSYSGKKTLHTTQQKTPEYSHYIHNRIISSALKNKEQETFMQ